jgi:hypothetical protein
MGLAQVATKLRAVDKALEDGDVEQARVYLRHARTAVAKLIEAEGQTSAAAELGRLGGTVTAKRGPDYFRELAGRRKTHGGGRPRKDAV